MKSRGCYETPGGTLIMAAHRELESLTLDKNTLHYKQKLALDYAEMVYNGLWFTPLRESLDAFFEKTSETTTGEVTLRLYKGEYRAGQPQVAVFALFAQHRQLHHGRRIRSEGRARLHQPDRPADPGAGVAKHAKHANEDNETLGRRVSRQGPRRSSNAFPARCISTGSLLDADIRGSQAFARALGARRAF